MAKLKLLPKINSNFGRAIYIGLLFGLLKVCVDELSLQVFGQHVWAMVLASSLVAVATFAYVVYLILEMQDRMADDDQK